MIQVRAGFMAYALTLVPRGLLPRGLSKGGVRYVSQMSAAFPPHTTPFFCTPLDPCLVSRNEGPLGYPAGLLTVLVASSGGVWVGSSWLASVWGGLPPVGLVM